MKEAMFYRREEAEQLRCTLCPRSCRIAPGKCGYCGVRRNSGGRLEALTWCRPAAVQIDPIEKKPLAFFLPGSRTFSLGTFGCNLGCVFCQNDELSRGSYPLGFREREVAPEEIVEAALRHGCRSVAFTYNEPGIWFEYIMDVMRADPDLHLVLVTNGFLNEEPLRQLCGVADAINLDVKGFTEDFYGKICEGRLADVMRSARIIRDEGVHLEITYLVIPGHNDSEDEVGSFCGWVRDELGADVPVHFTRFHPDFEMMDVPMTPVETVMRCREIGMGCGLEYVFVGNVVTEHADNTYCPGCGAMLVSRLGYLVDIVGLDGDRCSSCGRRIPIRLRSEVPKDSPESL